MKSCSTLSVRRHVGGGALNQQLPNAYPNRPRKHDCRVLTEISLYTPTLVGKKYQAVVVKEIKQATLKDFLHLFHFLEVLHVRLMCAQLYVLYFRRKFLSFFLFSGVSVNRQPLLFKPAGTKTGKLCQTGRKTLRAQIVPLRYQLFTVSVKVCGRGLREHCCLYYYSTFNQRM